MRLLLAILFAAFVCSATPTTITDTLLQPNGSPAAGVDFTITQSAFFSGSTYYPAWALAPHPVTDANGLFSFSLEPNPAGQLYAVTLKQSNGVATSSCWNVAASVSPVNLKTVLSTTCGTPPLSIVQLGQLAQGGAVQGNIISWNNTVKTWVAGSVNNSVRLTFLNCAAPCIVGDQSNWKQSIMTISSCLIDAAVYPTGANLTVDIKKNPTPVSLGVWTGGTTIFSGAVLTLPGGGTAYATQSGIAAAGALAVGDYLVSFVTAIGSSVPGQGVNIVCVAQ